MKKKWTAIAWTALYMAITFMVQLMLSFAYGMIAFFVAFQSAGRTMDTGAVQEGIQYAMGLLTKGWMMILITLLCDMVLMAGFGTWYYFRERQYPFRPNYKSAFSLKNIGYIIVMGVLGQYASNLIATLTGVLIPSAMDSYEEASSNFEQAYGEDATYDRALQIYGAYLDKDMEADGTRYLEAALSGNAKNAQDHCDRGRVYYYMDDYENATAELKQAIDGDNTEALALLGMVYMDQGDSANARTMFQQYVSQAENGAKGFNGLALCDIEDGDYDSALSNISSGIHVADAEDMQSLLFNEIAVYEKKLDFQTALQKANEYLGLYPDDKTVKKELAFLKTRVSGEDSSADSQLSD